MVVTPIGRGAFRVEHDGESAIVYVAGDAANRWVFWNGHVFRAGAKAAGAEGNAGTAETPSTAGTPGTSRTPGTSGASEILTAPMPARVVQVLVQPGASVKKGDTIVLLEAMKMELPVRALADGTVRTVHCHDGELVDADAPLVELT
jgi:biotin carboxyl carrier protein